ncbi:hypothetical protein PT277_10210 [Acetobacteraceae bacterium ESL0709]|nr:hypothetical protein [Acetobacteraceae bacterium ESL0709]
MSGEKPTEGLIPEGLVVSNLHGEIGGILTVSGVVERSNIKAGKLMISASGMMRNGSVDAEEVTIAGCVSNVLLCVSRLNVMRTATMSDCVIEISHATGFSVHENAHFDGEIKLTTKRHEISVISQSQATLERDMSAIRVGNMVNTDIEADIPLGD